MNAFFYPRLALSGMRRDRRIYAPYLAACVFMTAVVYDLAFLADSPVLYCAACRLTSNAYCRIVGEGV